MREWNDEIVFLHKIVAGGTDRSYGIHVARLAGVPKDVLERARRILSDIEKDAEHLAPRIARGSARSKSAASNDGAQQLALFEPARSAVEQELEKLELDRLTPIEALLVLRELKSLL